MVLKLKNRFSVYSKLVIFRVVFLKKKLIFVKIFKYGQRPYFEIFFMPSLSLSVSQIGVCMHIWQLFFGGHSQLCA